MSSSSEDVRLRVSFESNKIILKVLSNFYISEPKKHKRFILIHGNEQGITFNTYGDRTGRLSLFLPRDMFSEYFESEIDNGTENDFSNGICISYGLLLDFLHLSLTRGNRLVEFTAWNNRDYVNLKCPETEFDGCLAFEINLPTVEYVAEGNIENLTPEIEAKINSSGEKLDLICSLIDSSFDTVTTEFDSESSSIKFISESDNHSMDFVMTDDMEDCTFHIAKSNSYSYCAAIFRQLHAFLQKTHKSSLRIHTGGLIIINLIINIGDIMAFLTVVRSPLTKISSRADKGEAKHADQGTL